ncbi:MAG: tripartite tricarboxylate transporter substrate binding protein [Betaproteobacteria bacterium]|nr:tripartite tricarboxylate transporter substrate binding protein [Betaproteobacteria bacterium]
MKADARRCIRYRDLMCKRNFLIALVFSMPQPYAHAVGYPDRPIRLVVPLAPGGTTDILARLVAQRLTATLGQPVIVDNRPGAGGNIGNEVVARSAADGYTLLMAAPPLVINPGLYAKVGYRPVDDYTPISLIASVPVVLAVNPGVQARSVRELLTLAKAHPGKYNYASSGVGGTPHLAGALFASMAAVDIVHVPYKGSGPALTDLLGGQVHMQFSGLPPLLPFIRSGKLRALGVASTKRTPALPEVPTIVEAGLAGYEATSWQGLSAPARLPREITALLNATLVKFIAAPETRARFAELGAEPVGSSPAEFARFIKVEFDKWGPVIRQTGARAD